MVPSRGKNKVEIRLRGMLIALASAEGLQVELLGSLSQSFPLSGQDPLVPASHSPGGDRLGHGTAASALSHKVSWCCSRLTLNIEAPVLPQGVCLQSR